MAKITVEEFTTLIKGELPWAEETGMRVEAIGPGTARLCLPFDDSLLRPGGTVSGPSMMALADATMYAVVLSEIGEVKLAVTTSFNINFLRRPEPGDIAAEGRSIKVGKRLAVMEVTLYTVGDADPVAHATGTYSIPPRKA